MLAEAVNPATGEKIAFEISVEELDQFVREARPGVSRKVLERRIGNLALPAEVKVLLDSLMSITVKIGNFVVYIGRRVLEIVFDLCRRYAEFTFAVVMCLVATLLPMVVPALAPILVPLFVAVQLLHAFVKDWLSQRTNEGARKVEQGDEMDAGLNSLADEPVGREAKEALQPFALLNAAA